ncbi:MAG: retropepsin-like domain-containing protein, partial [Cohaesibacter sp.]|nr:retropepsin-like domain-containing protein [Cohaesibacter sp.]
EEKFYQDEDDDNMGNTDLASAQSTVQIKKKMKFIMDTGCGYDLISRRKATELDLPIIDGNDRMVFMTANGITETREVAKCSVDSFNEVAKPFVLDQSPAVFSVGMRCMKLGYTFVWPPNGQPFMINESGKRIDLHSKDDIPYLIPGDGSSPHDDQLASDIYNLLNKKGVVTDAPAAAGEDGEGGDDVEEEVVEEEDAEGVIEVDVHEGEPRLAKPGVLKAEAKTIA